MFVFVHVSALFVHPFLRLCSFYLFIFFPPPSVSDCVPAPVGSQLGLQRQPPANHPKRRRVDGGDVRRELQQ